MVTKTRDKQAGQSSNYLHTHVTYKKACKQDHGKLNISRQSNPSFFFQWFWWNFRLLCAIRIYKGHYFHNTNESVTLSEGVNILISLINSKKYERLPKTILLLCDVELSSILSKILAIIKQTRIHVKCIFISVSATF